MNVARTNAMERRYDCWLQDVYRSFDLRHTDNNNNILMFYFYRLLTRDIDTAMAVCPCVCHIAVLA